MAWASQLTGPRRRCTVQTAVDASGQRREALLAELRELLLAALPIAAVQLGLVTMGIVDTLMVGRLSAEALGGVALGVSWRLMLFGVGEGALKVLDGLIGETVGAGEEDAVVGRILVRGLVLGVIYTVILAPAFFVCEPSLAALGQPPTLLPLAGQYAKVQSLCILPNLWFVVLRSAFQAVGSLGPILWSILLANALNPVLNYVMIWGLPACGLHGMNAIGSAWATVLSSLFALLALPFFGRRTLSRYLACPSLLKHSLEPRPLLRLVALGLPVGLFQFTETLFFSVTAVAMGAYGVFALDAHQVVRSMACIAWNIALGIGAAAAVQVGKAVGRQDPVAVRSAIVLSLALGAGCMCITGSVMIACPVWLAGLWSSDTRVMEMSAKLFPIAGALGIFDGLATIAGGVERGLLDTQGLALASFVGYWVVGTPASLLFSRTFGLGVEGIWWGMALGIATTCCMILRRVWRVMKDDSKLRPQVQNMQ